MPKRTKHYLSAALLLACMGCQPCAEYIKADKEWLDVMEPHLKAGIALEPDAETRTLLLNAVADKRRGIDIALGETR